MRRILCFLCLMFMFVQDVSAKVEYAVTIPVDVDAENSVLAKELAMLDAQRQAFLQVARMFVPTEDGSKLEALTDDEIVHFIKSVGVADEKAGGTKYIANLTVQVNERLLEDYLTENEMMPAETADILVMPVFKSQDGKYPLLWEENNVWRQFWQSKGLIKFGSMQIRTAYDSLREIDDLTADGALYMGSDLYNQLVEAGKTDKVYAVYAEGLANGDLKITIKNEKNKAEDNFTIYNSGEDNIFDKAVEKSVMFISNMERETSNSENNVSFGNINAVYIYQNMKDWLDKSKMIENLPQVENIETKSFGGGKVNFSIRYTGSLEKLWDEMQDIGLSHETADNYFVIR